MTAQADLEYAEKVAKCIYIAADKVVADDVSHTMRGLISEIEQLRARSRRMEEALEQIGIKATGPEDPVELLWEISVLVRKTLEDNTNG